MLSFYIEEWRVKRYRKSLRKEYSNCKDKCNKEIILGKIQLSYYLPVKFIKSCGTSHD